MKLSTSSINHQLLTCNEVLSYVCICAGIELVSETEPSNADEDLTVKSGLKFAYQSAPGTYAAKEEDQKESESAAQSSKEATSSNDICLEDLMQQMKSL